MQRSLRHADPRRLPGVPTDCGVHRDLHSGGPPLGHRTKPGVWALIHMTEGRLLYRVLESGSDEVLEAGGPHGVIEPEILHEVAPVGAVRFFVEFYRQPENP